MRMPTPAGVVHIVVMGVSGSGKSVVGQALARVLDAEFVDADDLHPASNIVKMSSGEPLTDDDRQPWLAVVGLRLSQGPGRRVIACSALKRAYRDVIRSATPDAIFVHLTSGADTVAARVADRHEHFMPASLVLSQFEILKGLDADERGVTVASVGGIDAVVTEVVAELGTHDRTPQV